MSAQHRLLGMLFMVSIYFLVELTVGYATGSLALVADSFHMLGDGLALAIAFYTNRISTNHTTVNTYGWQRAELLGGLVNGVFLAALCFTMFLSAVQRFFVLEEIREPKVVLIVGGIGLAMNLAGLALFSGHGHSHGTDSGYEPSTNMRAVFLHVLGDALGSVAVMVSALVVWLAPGPNRHYIDPVLSLLIAALVLYSVAPLVKKCGLALMLGIPPHINVAELREEILQIDGVDGVHDFHIWQLSDAKCIASVHVVSHTDFMKLGPEIQAVFHRHGVHATTIQAETADFAFDEIAEVTGRCLLPCNADNSDLCRSRHCCDHKLD